MRRRDTLRKCATLGAAGSLGLLAGCSGVGDQSADESESASLSVKTFDYLEGDSGELVVTVTVENTGESAGMGHLYVTVVAAEKTTVGNQSDENSSDGDGDDDGTVATRESLEVKVPAGETKTVEIPFEFTVEQFERNGSLDIDLRD